MIGKNNHYLRDTKDGTKVESYSIKKFKVGAASVVIGASIFFGAGAVAQASEEMSNNTTADNTTSVGEKEGVAEVPVATAQPVAKETTKEDVVSAVAAKLGGETAKEVKALDKTTLEKYVAEIEAKLVNGTYANKTEESVALLKADLEAAKTTLANATTQDELTKAYGKLVTTANTKLKAKPVEKKETPEVDTTNGQPTVGKKAENTEKKSESNSIENTGSNDSRNGQALDKNNAFRAEAAKPVGQTPEITSNLNGKSSTPADVTVKAPAGSTVKLYNKDGVVIGEAVANDQGVATVHPTNSLPEGEITATSTPAGGTESAKSSPVTVTKTPVTDEGGGVSRGGDNTQLLVSKSHITVYPGDSVKVDVIAASNAIENFSVPGNPTAISGVLPVGAFLTTAGSSTYKQRNAAYQGTVAEAQKAGDTVVTFSVRSKRNAVVTRNLKVTVLESAKKYEPVAGTKVDIADSNNVSGDEKNKIIAAVKAANSSLPADSQYSIDEKGNLTITYPDGSTDKIAAAYLVNPTTPTPPVNQSAPVVAPTAEIPFSNAETKEIYLYNEEDASINITINSTNGAISKAFIKSAGNVYLDPDKKARKLPPGNETQEEVDGFGWTYHQILNDTPSPATVRITGKPNDTFKGLNAYTKQEDQNAVLGDRYLQVQDTAGGAIAAGGNSNAAGYFKLVVKSQTYKYDIKDLTDSTRITVNDINNVTDAELTTIKSRLQLEYSQKSNDARFVRGAAVANPTSLIDTVAVSTTDPSKLVVTYIDGSTDTIEKNKVLNVRPKGIIPFSNPATKEIYVYKGEETNIELSATDDSGKIKDIRIAEGGRGNNAPGAAGGRIKNQYGLTTGYQRNEAGIEATETNPAKVTITGTISVPNQPNYTGNLITRYLVAEDLEGATFSEPNGNSDSGKTVDQLPEGWFRLVVREQTQKYDIQGQTEEANKIAVSDVNNLSTADFEKIKNNIKIQYKTADDERLKDKDGTLVENASQYIKSITKEGDKIVVTYKDGSTDKLTLTDVVTLDKQPAIDAVNTAATEKIAAIKATPNATDEEKAAAIAKVNADKEKALTAIKDASVRTKDALNQAQNNGTAAIAADNPVVAKKADAKAAIETARKAKEDAIKANTNLTEDEKTAAIAKVNDAATAATTKIDSATANKAVEDAQNEATTAIGKVNPVAKEAAKKAVSDELATKNTEIDNRQDLSQAEKTAAKAEAKKLADAQLAEIAKQPDATETPEAATTAQQAVDAAKTKGVADVRAVNPLAKDAAKADIETARQNKVNDITNNNNLSQAEKDAAIAKVNKVAEDATKAVDAATSADALTAAKGDGTTAINNVTPVAKEAAKQAIADALNGKDGQKGKLQEIEERTDLTTEEKAAAKKDAQDKANAELAKINAQPDAADTQDAATAAQTAVDAAGAKGKTDVESVNPAAKAKPEAKAAVEATRKAKEDAIKADANLTDDEKTAAIAKANKAAEDATKAIDAATTNQAVTDAQTAATTAVGKVNPIAKENAKTAIATALTAKNNEIDNRQDLTDAEKKVAKDAAKAKADAELAKINAQPDNAETADAATAAQTAVNDAGTKGVADVKTVNPIAKEKAKEAIATALTAKNGEIDARQDLTDDEKTAAKAEAKKLADVETAKVAAQPDNAETADAAITAQTAVNDAKDKGVGDVTAVRPIAKEKAKEVIAAELTKKEAAIDDRTDLTTEEKAAAKKDAQAKAKTATDAITAQPAVVDSEEKATAAQGAVDTAKNTGVSEVQAVNPTAVKKPEAKAAVEAARKAKEDAIKADSNLTQAEKDVAIAKNNKAAEDATKAIDAATTDTVVEQAKTAGTGEIAKVNPVAKEKAKEAIATALTAKNNEIDARKDLTDDEKTAAKAEAKKLADAETAKVDGQPDNAETADAATAAQTAVNDAKDKGVGDVTAVRPIAKEKAKEAIADELTKKEAAIDARTDLTTEEKDAAKKDAQDKAKAATDAINAQPAIVDTEEKATAAQGAVDTAKTTGVSEVQAVNPTAVTKPAAKKTVADALKAKEEAIDARTDLSDKEKAAAKLAAKNIADAAKKAIDNATTDADVANAQTAGTNDIATVNPVAKEKAKQAVADELAKKEEAIDARDDLTQEEKDAAKKEAQAKAKEATDAINAQPDTVDTPEEATTAQQAVDAAKDKGVADVAAVNPTAVTKPAAKKAIEDKLVKQLEDIANTPDATDEEKAEATEKAKAAVEKAKAEVDKATTDAAVKTEKDKAVGEGDTKGTIDQAVPVVEDKPNARKAIDEQTKAKKAEIDARTDLSPKAKEALKAKVDKVAKKAKEGIDAVTSKADVDVIKEADKAAIKAIGEVNRPIDKVLVKDPSALTDEEKAKILEEVKKVNPTAKEVKYDDNGKIEVTTEAGDKGTINPTKLVKTEDQLDNGKGGNDINKPLDKVIVKDPSKLTDEEKAKIVAEVEEVNPDAIVTIDENGTVSVSTPDGKTAAIPATDLVRTKEDTSNPDAGNSKIVKPADKVVGNPTNLDDRAKVEEKLRELNPEAKSVIFDENGNATVTLKDGTTATIPEADLFKSEAYLREPNAGNDIVKPADKSVVANPEKLTDAEKKAIEDKVKAVNPGATVVVDDKGNATVTTPEGKTAVIPAIDLVKSPEEATKPNAGNDVNTPADKTVVADPNALTPEEKKAIEDKVKAVNPGATVAVDDKGNATVTTPEGKTAVIPAADLTKSKADAAKPNAGNDVVKPADKTVVANPNALTPEEKKSIEDKVKAVNPDATVVVDDKGNATVTLPNGKTAVIPAVDLTKSKADAAKPNAGNDIVKPADKSVVANPEKLTDAEKKAIEDKVKAVNPGATVVVDDKGNATVTLPNGKTAVIPATDLTKSPEEAAKPNAGNDIVKPADKSVVANPEKLTDAEKKAIEDKVKAVNPGATVVVDDKGNATVTLPNGKTAVIPAADLTKTEADAAKPNAGNDVNTPADKTVVADPNALTPEEKKAIEDKVKAVNPGAEVVVDDKGNATVTTPEGKTAVIPAADLTKSPEEAAKPNAGNDVVKPADKTVVADPNALTPEEKKAIEDKVKAVNPDATVVVDDKGNATVTPKDGKPVVIPAADLTKSKADAAKPNAGNDIVKPADKTVVADPNALTPEEKKAIEDKVKAVNPGAEVVVDDKGNATVTTPEGKTAVIPATDLTKSKEDADKPNAGNDVNTPADKTVVANPNALTPEEKKAIEDKVAAVNPGSTVVVDDKGNATVTTPEGKTAVIPAADLTKSKEDAAKPNAGNDVVKPADKTVVANPNALTPEEKKAIEDKVKAVNPDATVVVDDKGNATVTPKDGKPVVIPAADLTKSKEDAAKPNAGNDVVKPADKTVVANPNALTPEEKKAIEDKVKAVNPGATVVVDDKGNATVTTPEGKTAVIPAADLTKSKEDAAKPNAGNDIVKPADKTVVADPAKLTDEEKQAIAEKVKAVNPGAEVVVDDKGNATVTKDGKTAVIPAADLTKSKEDAAKPNAGNDVVKPADKTVVADPAKLTDEEKQAIADKVKAVNPEGTTVVVDDKGNATVTLPNGKTAVIPAADLTKNADAEKAPKAGNDIVKPASKVLVKDPESLTKDEKDAIAAKVEAVNPGAKVVVDDKGNATVTLPNGNTAVIPASDLTKSEKDVNEGKAKDNAVTPAAKTKVANPEKLTDAEKKAIEDKVKALNPGATVVVDDKGNATVVKDGNVSVIPSTDLVKVEDDAKKENGGNDANTPAAKTVVTDSDKLTDAEKAAVKKAVEAVNPGSTVVVDDKGNATVTKADGTVLNIPASDLVIPADNLAGEAKNAKVKTPATRTLVENKGKLTDAEKEAVKKSIEAVNPGATVVVDNEGNATVTLPDGSTATISKEQLVKDKETVSKSKHGGDNLDIDLSKVPVGDINNITPEERAKFQFKVLGAITNVEEFDIDAFLKETDEQGNTIYTSKDGKVKITIDKDGNATIEKDGKKEAAVSIDKAGNVTIVTKEGQVLAIPRDDAFKQKEMPTLPGKVEVGNVDKLTDAEKAAVKEALIKANPKLKDANITIADNGDATIVYPDGQVVEIPGANLVTAKASDNGSNGNTGTDADAAESNAQGVNAKLGQRLANTGTTETNTGLAGLGLGILGGLLAAARRRKNDKN